MASSPMTPSLGQEKKHQVLVDQLLGLRTQVDSLEKSMLGDLRANRNLRLQVKKVQKLLKLQKLEKELGQKRLQELEHTIHELEIRKASLNEKKQNQQRVIRKFLIAIDSSRRQDFFPNENTLAWMEQEKIEAPKRKVLSNLVERGFKELEMLKADLVDASQLGIHIVEEKQQLSYLFQNLKEQESVLEFNRQLKLDLLKKKQTHHVLQFENYRKLKDSEAHIESLIGEFNARKELEHSLELEKKVSKAMIQGDFLKMRGKLSLPVSDGKVVSSFGRAYDSHSGLFVFKKGIDISVKPRERVKAVSSGKVAYAGELPNYGQVVIIDHGGHFYSLCAHLGAIFKKTNERVAEGDFIGLTADRGTPLYFEIRARNVAVNPLQWIFN